MVTPKNRENDRNILKIGPEVVFHFTQIAKKEVKLFAEGIQRQVSTGIVLQIKMGCWSLAFRKE
jgi:hypothetical protein